MGNRETALANLRGGQVRPHDPNLRHGVDAFLDTGRVPKKFQPTVDRVLAWREEVLAAEAIGNDPDPNPKRLAVVDSATRSLTVVMLCFEDLLRRGLLVKKPDGSLEPNPTLTYLGRFEGVLAKALDTLGLERKARKVPSLTDYIKQSAGNAPSEGDENAPPESARAEQGDDKVQKENS